MQILPKEKNKFPVPTTQKKNKNAAFIGVYFGLISILLSSLLQMYTFNEIISNYGLLTLGVTVFLLSLYYLTPTTFKNFFSPLSKTSQSFLSIDMINKNHKLHRRPSVYPYKALKEALANGKIINYSGITKNIVTPISNITDEKDAITNKEFESIQAYFKGIKSVLEEKSKVADQKASILLDKGTKYARNGILFYIFTIITWQLLAWDQQEFKIQFIFGLISCSLLFVFIEFLSAWYLKQYRHFIDTSTYLIKVKSIFDKYMLLILFTNESSNTLTTDHYSSIISILGEEFKWPDISKFSREDISFAKEAMETATSMLKSIRDIVPQKSEK